MSTLIKEQAVSFGEKRPVWTFQMDTDTNTIVIHYEDEIFDDMKAAAIHHLGSLVQQHLHGARRKKT